MVTEVFWLIVLIASSKSSTPSSSRRSRMSRGMLGHRAQGISEELATVILGELAYFTEALLFIELITTLPAVAARGYGESGRPRLGRSILHFQNKIGNVGKHDQQGRPRSWPVDPTFMSLWVDRARLPVDPIVRLSFRSPFGSSPHARQLLRTSQSP